MPKYKEHDVVRLTMDLINISNGYNEIVSLNKGELGTIMQMKGDWFLVEFSNDTEALIELTGKQIEPLQVQE